MDYFTELLESYSRLKKRELVLLEKEEKKAKKKPQEKKKEKPDKVVQEYTPEQVIVAALKTPVSYPPYNEAAFHPIPGLVTKDEEGNEKEVLAYQSPPAKRKKGEEGGVAPIQRAGTVGGAIDQGTVRAQTGGAQHGKIVAWAAGRGGNNAVVINADGSPNEPAFTNWYNKYFKGKEAIGQTDGIGLEAALNRVGESLGPILNDEGVDDSVQQTIFTQVRSLLGIASELVVAARDAGGEFAQKPWAGWKEGEEGKPGRYVGRGEDNSDDPEMTRSVGSYISGRSAKSIEYQIAHGKTVEFDEDSGAQFDTLARDPMLIQGALDSVEAFMELGKPEVPDRPTKCADIGRRVQRKADRLVFFKNEDPNQGIAIKRNDMFKFVESQIEELCGEGIQVIPQGNYTPQQLNDMRGKGMEQGSVAVGVLPNIAQLPESTDEEVKKKEGLYRKMGLRLRRELLADQKRFSAAFTSLTESEQQDAAYSLRASFVVDALKQLNAETNTPEKLRAFFQRNYELEAPVVEAIGSKFTFPVGGKTGIGLADDLEYAFLDRGTAVKASGTMKLVGDNTVQGRKVSEIVKEQKELGNIFKDMYDLSDDDTVYIVGSGQKSYFEDASSKIGETTQRSATVNGTADNIAYGFEDVTMKRMGINQQQLDGLRAYQSDLDAIQDNLNDILPEDGTVSRDPNTGNTAPINFNTVTTMVESVVSNLELDSDVRSKLSSIIKNYRGITTNLNGPDNKLQRLDMREELFRVISTAKQMQDMNNFDDLDTAMDARRNLAYTIHMTGGVVRDGILNKKIFDTNTVRAGSHMAPIIDATKGLLDLESGHKIKMSTGGASINLINPDGGAVTLGAERTRGAGDAPVTRYVVNINKIAQSAESGVGLNETIDISDPVEDSLMITFLKGQAELLEQLLANS